MKKKGDYGNRWSPGEKRNSPETQTEGGKGNRRVLDRPPQLCRKEGSVRNWSKREILKKKNAKELLWTKKKRTEYFNRQSVDWKPKPNYHKKTLPVWSDLTGKKTLKEG